MLNITSTLILVLSLAVTEIVAFNSETHMMINRLAYDILHKENPSALRKATYRLRQYTDSFTVKTDEHYPFVESVTWADDSKRHGGGW